MAVASSASSRSVSAGSNAFWTIAVPPTWKVGLVYMFSPPVWKQGSRLSVTSASVSPMARPILSAL